MSAKKRLSFSAKNKRPGWVVGVSSALASGSVVLLFLGIALLGAEKLQTLCKAVSGIGFAAAVRLPGSVLMAVRFGRFLPVCLFSRQHCRGLLQCIAVPCQLRRNQAARRLGEHKSCELCQLYLPRVFDCSTLSVIRQYAVDLSLTEGVRWLAGAFPALVPQKAG